MPVPGPESSKAEETMSYKNKQSLNAWGRRAALALAVTGGYVTLGGAPAFGETYTFTRGAGTNNWSVDGNWQTSSGAMVRPPSVPPVGEVTDLVFAGAYGAGTQNTQNIGTITVNSITFGSFTTNNGTLTVSASSTGDQFILLGAGGIVGDGSGTISFPAGANRKIILTADQTWSNNNTTGIISQRRQMEGAFEITKVGPGTIEFQGTNDLWTGGLDIQEGFIRLSNSNNAIGSGTVTANTSNNVGLSASGTTAVDQVIAGPLVLGGTGSFSFGGSWAFDVNGPTTLLSDKNVVVSQPARFNGAIGGDFRLIKLGGGTMTLGADNTNAGFDVRGGTLEFSSDARLGSAGGALGLGSSMTSQGTLQTGTARVTAPITSARNVNILDAAGGAIDTNGHAVTFGQVAGAGAFTKRGDGQLTVGHVRATDFAVRGGSVRIAPSPTPGDPAGTSVVTSLSLNDGATPTPAPTTLDLTNNGIVVDYTGASPMTDVRGAIVAAYNNGAWDQPGLTSSQANNTTHGVGYAESADVFTAFPASFMGQNVDNTAVLARYTRYGDANLDGLVNLADFNRLASNFGASGRYWHQADFNYDGLVNLADFNRLAANFGLAASGTEVTPEVWAALAS